MQTCRTRDWLTCKNKGSGPKKGEFLFEIPNMKPRISVPRASLLKELLAHLPEKILHANMKLTSIDQGPDGVDVTFEDGSTRHFDAVIGADGVGGHVRGHVLPDQEHSSPAGFWDCWGIFPSEKVRESVDEEYLRPGQQYAFTADGALLLYALVAGGTMVQAIISSKESPEERRESRRRKLEDEDKEILRQKWNVANGIVEVRFSRIPIRSEWAIIDLNYSFSCPTLPFTRTRSMSTSLQQHIIETTSVSSATLLTRLRLGKVLVPDRLSRIALSSQLYWVESTRRNI